MTTSKIFFYFCFSFIGGIFFSSFFEISVIYLFFFLIFGFFLISVFWKYKILVIGGFCILFLAAGIWRHQTSEFNAFNNELTKLNDSEQKIILIGIVTKEPEIREKSQKLTIAPNEIKTAENLKAEPSVRYGAGSSQPIKGMVLATVNRYPEYRYGDELQLKGKLKSPQEFEDFNYKDYLAKDGIYSVMDFPEIELSAKGKDQDVFSKIYAQVLELKNKLRNTICQNLSPPQSAILGAIMLGDKGGVSPEWKEKLNVAGVRHITAISGLHVTILTIILMTILIGFGFWRQQAFYFTVIIIFLFIVMTGLQPSAVRAGIMGGLFLSAQHFGRQSVSERTIFFAAALMLTQNPLLLKLDIGFQLSFLAIMGIIYFLPILRGWLKRIPNFWGTRDVLAMTVSAQVFTLPILIYNFGYVSLIAPITNVLIVPFLYWIMLFGFIFGLAGLILQQLAWILSWPCWLLLTYLTKIVDWFSEKSFAVYYLEISWIWLIIFYLVLGFITWRLKEGQKLKFLNY